MSADRRWKLLEDARRRLLDRFRRLGVVKIEYVTAFPSSATFVVWLCTATDRQREDIDTGAAQLAEVRQILMNVGFDSRELDDVLIVTQSLETVDRDHRGSWFYAMR